MLRKVLHSVRANILVGFVLTIPIVATVLVFDFLLSLATNWLPPDTFPTLRPILGGYLLRFLTLLAIVALLYLVGLLVRNIIGRRLYQVGDMLLTRIPLFKNIYRSMRQISEALFTQRKTLFQKVVLIEYPRRGLHSIAFVTARLPAEFSRHLPGGSDTTRAVSLFVPTTPNPTSGVLILAREEDIVELGVPVHEALTFVMSAGAVHPDIPGTLRPTLLDKLEAWLTHDERD